MADNQKARRLRQDGKYERVAAGRADPLRVQEYLYQVAVAERERVRALTPVRFVPIEGAD
jgi:hypothetical protein